jgi:anti-sigma B factor antagonist
MFELARFPGLYLNTMETLLEKAGHVQVIHLRGRLDLSATPEFEQFLLQLIETGERRILLDCTDLRYISSSGLGVFVAAGKQLGEEGKLAFASLNPHIRHVFDLVRFDSFFEVFPSKQEGIDQLNAQA